MGWLYNRRGGVSPPASVGKADVIKRRDKKGFVSLTIHFYRYTREGRPLPYGCLIPPINQNLKYNSIVEDKCNSKNSVVF